MRAKSIEGKAYWLKHIKNYKASGLNKNRYCNQYGITYHKFLYWFDKLAIEALQPQSVNKKANKANRFIKVKLNSEHDSVFDQSNHLKLLCIMELKQGHRLLIHDADILEKLLLLLND